MPEGFYEPFEDELEAIRLNLYERTKHMTVEEKVVYLQARVEPLYEEFNIRRSTLKPVEPRRHALVASE